MMRSSAAILLIAPIALIEIGIVIVALYDLFRPERRVKGGNKIVWAVIIVIFNLIGSLVYFVAGREET